MTDNEDKTKMGLDSHTEAHCTYIQPASQLQCLTFMLDQLFLDVIPLTDKISSLGQHPKITAKEREIVNLRCRIHILFPPQFKENVSAGERPGQLPQVCDGAKTHYREPEEVEVPEYRSDVLPRLEFINLELYHRVKNATQDDELLELYNNHSSAWKESFLENCLTKDTNTNHHQKGPKYSLLRKTEQHRGIRFENPENHKSQFGNECPECGKFSTPGNMLTHVKTHIQSVHENNGNSH